jgi:hypothetical protein
MERAVILRGRISGGRRIDLDEPLDEVTGEVEVVVRSVTHASGPRPDVRDVLSALPAGSRSQAELYAALGAERASWDDR